MVVGDDAQSIYSWRGANFENILKFPERHPEAQVHKIETNYRSVPEVLALANESIAANRRQFTKTLVAARPSQGMKPALVRARHAVDAGGLCQPAPARSARERGHRRGKTWPSCTARISSRWMCRCSSRRTSVPFVITSGLRFFEQAHVKDVIAFLKWAANPRDEVSFDRAVRLLPGVGPGAAAKLWQAWLASPAAAGEKPPAELLRPAAPAQGARRRPRPPGTRSAMCSTNSSTRRARPASTRHRRCSHSVVEGFYDDYLKQSFRQRPRAANRTSTSSRSFPSATPICRPCSPNSPC